MECERFKKLLKQWYIQVQDEALASARMVDFMESHLNECPICLMDPEARNDVKKIITLVLPQDKLKAPSRSSRKTVVVPDDDGFVPPPPPEGSLDGEVEEVEDGAESKDEGSDSSDFDEDADEEIAIV